MRASYRIELDEYLECVKKTFGLRFLIIALASGVFFGATMGATARFMTPVDDICEYGSSFLLCGPAGPEGQMALICIFVFGLPFYFLFRARMTKMLKTQFLASPLAQESLELSWSDEGIEIASRNHATQYKWSDLRHLQETERVLFIDARPFPALIMPKRAFLLPESLADLKDRLRAAGVKGAHERRTE